MSKWHSFLEYIQFPLKVLFLSIVLLGIGSLIENPNLGLLELFDSNILVTISEALRYIGGFMIELFPLLVFLNLLARKYEDSAPVFIGFVSLILITLMMMLLSTGEFPSYYYTNTLGIQIEMSSATELLSRMHSPFNTGIISIVIAYFITSFAYRRSRHHIRHGMFYFIDHDTWAILITTFLSIIAGVILAYGWPWVIKSMQLFFDYIADDIYEVGHMFFYGVVERVFALLNLDEIPKSIFWLSEAGGSVLDANGVAYLGDSGLWSAFMVDASLVLKTGHFMGAYYIINLSIMPAFILAYYRLMGKKKSKSKYTMFIFIALLVSIVSGNPLPIEILMVILSPLLYIFYLILVGSAFVIVSILGSLPGYSVNGALFTAMPGSIIDLIWNMQNPTLFESSVILLVSCLFFFMLFYIATIFYFKKCTIGFLSMHSAKNIAEKTKEAMGGIENIISVEATPDKMSVAFKSRDMVDIMQLHDLGAYLILESKDGYTIRMENMNIMISDILNKQLKEREV